MFESIFWLHVIDRMYMFLQIRHQSVHLQEYNEKKYSIQCCNIMVKMCPITILILCFAMTTVSLTETFCSPGQYVSTDSDGNSRCVPCRTGTFNPHERHRDIDCAMCTSAESFQHETVISVCDGVRDTVIGCRRGYYRVQVYDGMYSDGECLRCARCGAGMRTVRPCSGTSDTVCAPNQP
ncbi:unnamed protein product [Lymnaea stagnalis]|uniref:TNFR-Cys domain-containing protein n=1 Tax=Lymnaea stagnalis TaxID=6523 RepID=A0AAV2H2I8_LYMST